MSSILKSTFINSTPLTPLFYRWQLLNKLIKNKSHIDIGIAYTGLLQSTLTEGYSPSAAGGDFDIFSGLNFDKNQTNTRMLGFLVDTRHAFTAYPHADINTISNSIYSTTSGFNTEALNLKELRFEQHLIKYSFAYRIGRVDIMSLMNNYAFDSQNFYFLNSVFTSHPAIAAPDNGLELMINKFVTDTIYISGGITNINQVPITTNLNRLKKEGFIKQ